MSVHIGAEKGQIAQRVLLPGDPVRAEWIASTFLTDVKEYNSLRKESGYTGTAPNGQLVSVQSSGMGMPSLAIYVNELVREYGVREIIRIGSCGAFQPDLELGSTVLVEGSFYLPDPELTFVGGRFSYYRPNRLLFARAKKTASSLDISLQIGKCVASDDFYQEDPDWWREWAQSGRALVVEMESWKFFKLAKKFRIRALTLNTVSDYIPGVKEGGKQELSSEERAQCVGNATRIALSL